nr:PREDICTED: uncharacterized protein LOC109041405 [Bemisia tabaci]
MRLLCTAILWSILAASVAQYLAVPWDHARPVRVSDQGHGIFRAAPRLPRTAEPQARVRQLPGPRFDPGRPERQAHGHAKDEYVEFGAHTGHNGAFGWYADFPAYRQS